MEARNEAEIDDAVKPISIKKTEIILEQTKKCVCKIHNRIKKEQDFLLKYLLKTNY